MKAHIQNFLCSERPSLWHSSNQWSIRRNLTGKASIRQRFWFPNEYLSLTGSAFSLTSFLEFGHDNRMVQPSCNHEEGKARTIRITPAITSRTAAPKPAASLDFAFVKENRNPCCFLLFFLAVYLFLWPHHEACRVLVPQPGIKHKLPCH